jgi:hypothetical protein
MKFCCVDDRKDPTIDLTSNVNVAEVNAFLTKIGISLLWNNTMSSMIKFTGLPKKNHVLKKSETYEISDELWSNFTFELEVDSFIVLLNATPIDPNFVLSFAKPSLTGPKLSSDNFKSKIVEILQSDIGNQVISEMGWMHDPSISKKLLSPVSWKRYDKYKIRDLHLDFGTSANRRVGMQYRSFGFFQRDIFLGFSFFSSNEDTIIEEFDLLIHRDQNLLFSRRNELIKLI